MTRDDQDDWGSLGMTKDEQGLLGMTRDKWDD